MQCAQWLLDAEFDNKVKTLGIYGICGRGKSAIAHATHNLIADQFEGSCFLANIRETSSGHGLVQSQEIILSQLVGERNIKLEDVNHGISVLKERLHQKKDMHVVLRDPNTSKGIQVGPESVAKLNAVILEGDFNAEAGDDWTKEHFESHEVKEHEGKRPLLNDNMPRLLFGDIIFIDNFSKIRSRKFRLAVRAAPRYCKEIHICEGKTDAFVVKDCRGESINKKHYPSALHDGVWRLDRTATYKELHKTLMQPKILTVEDFLRLVKVTPKLRSILGTRISNRMSETTMEHAKTYVLVGKLLGYYTDEGNGTGIVFTHLYELIGLIADGQFFSLESLSPNQKVTEEVECALAKLCHAKLPERSSPRIGGPGAKNLQLYFRTRMPPHLFTGGKVEGEQGASVHVVLRDHNTDKVILVGLESVTKMNIVVFEVDINDEAVHDCTDLIEIHDSVGFLDKLQMLSAKGCYELRIVPSVIKLPSLEYLCLGDCTSLSLHIFPEIFGPMKKWKLLDFEGTDIKNLPLSIQRVGGLESLILNNCATLNIDALSNIQILPNVFPFLDELELDGSNFTMIPECIEECPFLRILSLNDCKQLREIRGLPQNIRLVWASNCSSLNIHCSTSSTLLNRIFQHGSTIRRHFWLAGERLPEWFDLCNRGNSVSFWFRNGIPDITVGVVTRGGTRGFDHFFKINNDFKLNCFSFFSYSCFGPEEIFIYNFSHTILSSCPTLPLNHGWNHVEILFLENKDPDHVGVESVRWTGVHVNRENTSMEDIQFTNPYTPKNTSHHFSNSNQFTLVDNGLHLTLPSNYVHCNSDSVAVATTVEFELDRGVLDHQQNAPGEPFHGHGFSKRRHFQEPTLSSGQVSGEELDLKICGMVLPTTYGSFRNQIEHVRDEAEMEAFYASLDGGTVVLSHSHDKSAIIASSEDAKEALKIVQDFISNDTSILLHPEQCSVMKASLDYLSNLSEVDGLSREMMALISKASREFGHWSKEYIEASMKIESIASELLRADELESDLEDNKKQFREAVALENELLQKLAWMEKRKKELEEEINAIKAGISTSQSRKRMARLRKKDIFEKGKSLKIKMDELREKVPHLKHEHGLAKRKQEKITAEWLKLGEKLRMIIVE